MLKKYKEFIKESINGYKYGCVMVDVPVNNWEEITSWIDPEDIYEGDGDSTYGVQKRPHLTLLYGLHKEVSNEEVKSIFDTFEGDINIEVDGVDIFENDKFDVVKFNVNPQGSLQNLFDELSKLPNSNEYPEYKPHLTIAYVKKGMGKKYVKPDYKYTVKNINKITYSHSDGNEFKFDIDNILESINENKMWYKSIPEILSWLDSKTDMPWVWLDTETTGLGGPKKEQLTQVSCLVTECDFNNNTFKELSQFDEKIKLTSDTKAKYNDEGDRTKWVLGFNHYGSGGYKYKDEETVVNDFFQFITDYEPCLLIAQNAAFDMAMLAGRYGNKIENEVFDTKMLIQLYFLPLLQKLAETDPTFQEKIDFIGTSPRDNGLISSSMSKIGPVLGINMSGYHDAITDCKITIQMYQGMIDLLTKHQDVDIMKYQIERIKVIRNK
jgi:2'-5' RNA ligase/DNA polymerase III epsilon subunit-like protein